MADIQKMLQELSQQGRVAQFIHEFNENPNTEEVVQALIDDVSALYNNPASPTFDGNFQEEKMWPLIGLLLYSQKDNLDLIAVGNYLGAGTSRNNAVLYHFVEHINFAGQSFVEAMQTYLSHVEIPKEPDAKKFVLQPFVEKYHRDNPNVMSSASSYAMPRLATIVCDELRSRSRQDLKHFQQQLSKASEADTLDPTPPKFPEELLKKIHHDISAVPALQDVSSCVMRNIAKNKLFQDLKHCDKKVDLETLVPGMQGYFIEPVDAGWQLITGTNKNFRVTSAAGIELARINIYKPPKSATAGSRFLSTDKTTDSVTITLASQPNKPGVPLPQSVEVASKIVPMFPNSAFTANSSYFCVNAQLRTLRSNSTLSPATAESSEVQNANQLTTASTSLEAPVMLSANPSADPISEQSSTATISSSPSLGSDVLMHIESNSLRSTPSGGSISPNASEEVTTPTEPLPAAIIFTDFEQIAGNIPSRFPIRDSFNAGTKKLKPADPNQIYKDFSRFPVINIKNAITNYEITLTSDELSQDETHAHTRIDDAIRKLLQGLEGEQHLDFEKFIRNFGHQGGFLHALESLLCLQIRDDGLNLRFDQDYNHTFTFTCTDDHKILMTETIDLPPPNGIVLVDSDKGTRTPIGTDNGGHSTAKISITSELQIVDNDNPFLNPVVRQNLKNMEIIAYDPKSCSKMFPKIHFAPQEEAPVTPSSLSSPSSSPDSPTAFPLSLSGRSTNSLSSIGPSISVSSSVPSMPIVEAHGSSSPTIPKETKTGLFSLFRNITKRQKPSSPTRDAPSPSSNSL